MHTLAAVQPDGIGGVDDHAEHLVARVLRDGEEARVDDLAIADAGAGEGDAGRVEAGLHDRVVAWVEVEVDGVADRGGEGFWGKDELPIGADVDVKRVRVGGAGGDRGGDGFSRRGGGVGVLGKGAGEEEGEGEGEEGDLI